MTKKDYIVIAKGLGRGLANSFMFIEKERDTVSLIIDAMANALAAENSKFDRIKFETAVLAYRAGYDAGSPPVPKPELA